jgi:subtilisin family serine protease
MKITTTLLALTFMSSSFAFDKAYVKGKFHNNPDATPLNFGLSLEQQERIAHLTRGSVDFRNHFVLRDLSRFKNLFSGSEKHFNHYLPPVMTTEFDPQTIEGWWQNELKVQDAWQLATGKGVTMADCDAGFYTEEEDIAGNLLMEFAQDFSDKDDPTRIDDGNYVTHGTAVAAMMVGILDGKGINGVSPDAKLVPLQNFNYNFMIDDTDKEEATAACILYALKIPEVKIIVLENQTHGSSETFAGTREAVKLALDAGVTIVSAAGNSKNELKTEELNDTGSIIVGAINRTGVAETFTNYGSRVSIGAYGSGLLTLEGPNGKLTQFGGTSGATPQVASTVALMLEVNPALTPAQIKEILVATRTTTEQNKKVGGMLNLVEAVKLAKSTLPDLVTTTEDQMLRLELIKVLK